MNQTIADSQKFDIVCMSFGKEIEKGIQVENSGHKSNLFEAMEIKVGKCTLKDMNFSKEQIETLKDMRATRKTRKALEKTETQR